MTIPILTGEEAAEYRRLYSEYAAAMSQAAAILRLKGMDSDEFQQADAVAGKLWTRLRALQGMAGRHWMA